jgi:hypothetical protein
MKARGIGNGMEVQERFNTGCWRSNGCCSVERWFVEMMSWLLFGQGFKACDAHIWTLFHQDVRIVGFLRQV